MLLKTKENLEYYKDMVKQLKKTNIKFDIKDDMLIKDKSCD